jgi:DNA-directed RNA polymerase
MELTSALRSEKPEEFESSLPVQQDGTCNGLQHYAALGGDENGAQQVNLAGGDKPADVYTAVADLVNKEIAQDVNSEKEEVRNTALALQGKVTRKVVKQTVRTYISVLAFGS